MIEHTPAFEIGVGIVLAVFGAFLTFLQRRSSKITDLSERVRVLETRADSTNKTLEAVEAKAEDIQKNMLRRGDIELLRSLLH